MQKNTQSIVLNLELQLVYIGVWFYKYIEQLIYDNIDIEK